MPFDWGLAEPGHPERGAWIFAEYTQPKDIAPFPQFATPDLSVAENMKLLSRLSDEVGLPKEDLAAMLRAPLPGATVIDLGSADLSLATPSVSEPLHMGKYDEIAQSMMDTKNYESWKKGTGSSGTGSFSPTNDHIKAGAADLPFGGGDNWLAPYPGSMEEFVKQAFYPDFVPLPHLVGEGSLKALKEPFNSWEQKSGVAVSSLSGSMKLLDQLAKPSTSWPLTYRTPPKHPYSSMALTNVMLDPIDDIYGDKGDELLQFGPVLTGDPFYFKDVDDFSPGAFTQVGQYLFSKLGPVRFNNPMIASDAPGGPWDVNKMVSEKMMRLLTGDPTLDAFLPYFPGMARGLRIEKVDPEKAVDIPGLPRQRFKTRTSKLTARRWPFRRDLFYRNLRRDEYPPTGTPSAGGYATAEDLLGALDGSGIGISSRSTPMNEELIRDAYSALSYPAFSFFVQARAFRGRLVDELISAIAAAEVTNSGWEQPLFGGISIEEWSHAVFSALNDGMDLSGLGADWWRGALAQAEETATLGLTAIDSALVPTHAERYLRDLNQRNSGGKRPAGVGGFALNMAEKDLIDLMFSPPGGYTLEDSSPWDFQGMGPANADFGRYLGEFDLYGKSWQESMLTPEMNRLNNMEFSLLAMHLPRIHNLFDLYHYRNKYSTLWPAVGYGHFSAGAHTKESRQLFEGLGTLVDYYKVGAPHLMDEAVDDASTIDVNRIIRALGFDLLGINEFARGGPVSGPGTSTSDSIPAFLSDGEFVMSARAVDHWGSDRLAAMNAIPRFSTGGPVSDLPLVPPPPPPKTITPNVDPFVPALPNEIPPQNDLNTLEPSRMALSALGSTPEQIGQTGAGIVGSILAPKGAGSGGSPGAPQPKPSDPRAAIAPPPTSSQHIHPAMAAIISAPIGMIGSAIGQAASAAASTGAMAALAGSTMGGGAALAPIVAPMVGAAAGQLAQFGTQIANDVTVGAANVLSSLLVGTVTPSQTGQGYGAPLLPPPTPPVNNFQSIHNGNVVTNNLTEYNRLKDRKDAQKAAPFFNRVGS